ncbi:DUF4168 domain-containing protein [Halomonas elongata]|uniref:DUF4168 domain protein n=2 Tax=Halomonas elongata TaxID=2746 RepID=E1V6U8_HALED|nr:DUF4168 domain-containing protein [Halomonas elongata]MBW5799590.1 DUF4168 domain-containing protein [Halomonas elongata]MDL4861397.1 DUF4168 domain-containing protein [Halomonas elongata]OBX34116.1 hypothetical protein A8U91_03161 [Halomonas elongata]RAW09110.1 DUF4168 domain-containing protein [Halomonas elongata]WBF17077.1 DUF4168 domain-containing protein [Halomonas elongata]
MQRFTTLLSAAVLTTGLMAGVAQAQESTTASDQAQTQAQAQTQNFSDEQLQKFADASQEIAVISQDYTKKLQGAEGEEAQQSIREEANGKMVEAVEGSGLDVETFNSIGQAIQQDPELMKQVQDMTQSQ